MMAGVLTQPVTPRPINSRFANAIELVHEQTYCSTNRGSFLEAGEIYPDLSGGSGLTPSRSVWFYYVADADGQIHIDLTMDNTYGSLMAVFTGSGIGSLTLVAFDEDDGSEPTGEQISHIDLAVTNGETYWIAVYGFPTVTNLSGTFKGAGPYCISLTFEELEADDSFARANFKTGTYVYDGAPVTAADVIDDPAMIIAGVGLVVAKDEWHGPSAAFVDDFLAFLLTGEFIIEIEWHRSESFASPLFISVAGGSTSGKRLGVEDTPTYFLAYDWINNGVTSVERDLDLSALGPGIHRLALRRKNDDVMAISVDGGVVIQDTASQHSFSVIPLTMAWLGGSENSFGEIVVGEIKLRPAGDTNAILPSLSVPSVLSPPDNDDFANAVEISVGQTLYGHNFCSSAEMGEPNHNFETPDHSVWWKFTPPSTGDYEVSFAGTDSMSDFGVVAGVYTGSAVDDLTEIASGGDWPSGPTIPFSATVGVTVYFAVQGWGGGEGNIQIALSAA